MRLLNTVVFIKQMALKSLSVHYTKIINDDRVPIDFDIVRKEDREKKCIACYINGFYLKNNLDLWKLHKNDQNVYKTLSKKRYKDYLKGVYIELCKGPDNTGDYLERSNHILNRVLECMRLENKENIQVFSFTHCIGCCVPMVRQAPNWNY